MFSIVIFGVTITKFAGKFSYAPIRILSEQQMEVVGH